jgi:flagellin
MTVINTNVGALMARTYATKANDKMQTSMERLSSGLRINSAADDAAGLAVANKMSSQLSGIKMAIRNSQDGISLVQTAEAGMGEITNMILRMRELAVQMENGIYTSKDRDNAQLEINALLAEVDKIATNTRFNDVAVLDGSYDQTIRAGNTNAETIRVAIGSLKGADNAKIEQHAVEKAYKTTAQQASNLSVSTRNEISVLEGNSVKIDTSLFSATFKEVFKADSLGTFSLAASVDGDADNEDNNAFTINAKTGEITSKYIMDADSTVNWDGGDHDPTNSGSVAVGGVIGRASSNGSGAAAGASDAFKIEVTYTDRNGTATTEAIKLFLLNDTVANGGTNDGGLSAIKVESQARATRAVETLDKALEEVSTAQAKLGAIQNRLSHNIDNLSKGSMLTEQSVGRIVDADFATETSELSKQQILAQAATSMLAQANQSKQSVLALLQ